MTEKRRDNHSTEFGLWLRGQLPGQTTDVKSIDSRFNNAQNLDYLWHAYKDHKVMLLEEKRYSKYPSYAQLEGHTILDQAMRYTTTNGYEFVDSNGNPAGQIQYYGYHLIVFEHTSPEDGRVWIDKRQIETPTLLSFLRFQLPIEFYQTSALAYPKKAT